MSEFQELKKRLRQDARDLPSVRVALLGDSSTQLLGQALRGAGVERGVAIALWEADYDQIEGQLLDETSEFHAFGAEFVILFHSTQKLYTSYCGLADEEKPRLAERHMEKVQLLLDAVAGRHERKVIYFNFPELGADEFGNFANKTESSFTYQLRMLNCELMTLGVRRRDFFIGDVCALQHRLGGSSAFDARLYVGADMVFGLDFLPAVARNTIDILQAARGQFKKCLILDLDNTLWGGVIGDDGLERIEIGDLGIGKAFTEVQRWARELRRRGVILAVCSKNDEKNAKEPFLRHPQMVLGLDDIAVFLANWNNKTDNLRIIQSVLNIGFDSMVFVDDSPFERELVRQTLPDVTVPELPEDPAEYARYLRNLNLFETASFTGADGERTRQYREEAARQEVRQRCSNEDEYLAGLEMRSEVKPFDAFSVPRVAQLTQRSNQFNLRTIRYSDEQIAHFAAAPEFLTLTFTLLDRFGDNGLVSAVILAKRERSLFIDTWVMSCRVLKRGMERFVVNEIVRLARDHGFTDVLGEYLPTPKNRLVEGLYPSLGFAPVDGLWRLDVATYAGEATHIRRKD